MSDTKSHIDVKVSIDSIRDGLRKLLVSNHSALIANVIIGNLAPTEVGLEQLYKAMSGVYEKPKYKIGDLVRIKIEHLYSWQFDKTATEKEGNTIDGRLLCQIISIDPTKIAMYEVRYQAVSGSVKKEITSMVGESKVHLDDEWPENMVKEDDLPF